MKVSSSSNRLPIYLGTLFAVCIFAIESGNAQEPVKETSPVRAFIDDETPGWVRLGPDDFAAVNSNEDTWSWKDDSLHCTGQPVSVLATKESFENVEIVIEWMHKKSAGNSGMFVWVSPESIAKLRADGKPGLPDGVEVQMLDHGYTDMIAKRGKPTDWFGTNGDLFGVRKPFKPFPPTSPNGQRSYPRKKLCNGHGQWNQYYVRAINGEVRLWVNGEEVSGGNGVTPASGHLCLESEGSPIEFRKIKVRRLP